MTIKDKILLIPCARRTFIVLLGALFICLIAANAQAHAYEKLFTRYSKAAGVPKSLVLAIARQESGLNPLCINIEGQDYTPASRAEAVSILSKAEAGKRSYDVGLMQINSQWIRKWKMDPASLLDPETNIRLGIKILRQEIDRHGLNWKAVGAYHSPTPERAMQYASRVFSRMQGRVPNMMGVNPRLGLSPRLEVLVSKGILTRAEAQSILANPRLRQGVKRSHLSRAERKAVMERYYRLRNQLNAERKNNAQTAN